MVNMMKTHLFDFMIKPSLFFYENLTEPDIILDEETSRHIISVLRMKTGEKILLTDGKGTLAEAKITSDNKKKCAVELIEKKFTPARSKQIIIGISLVKNASRFEWFIEKATEIGVAEIYPLICERTEKQHFRFERMDGIVTSAMLQSTQVWKPTLHHPVLFKDIISNQKPDQKFIAHCIEGNKINLKQAVVSGSAIILIGPEGDFTSKEIEIATDFTKVSLGETRLRTETAGIVAAAILCS